MTPRAGPTPPTRPLGPWPSRRAPRSAALLPEGDTGDWYALDVPHGSLIDLAFAPASGGTGLTVELYDANGYVVWSQQDVGSGVAKARYIVSDVEGGQYGVRVSGGEGAYEGRRRWRRRTTADLARMPAATVGAP